MSPERLAARRIWYEQKFHSAHLRLHNRGPERTVCLIGLMCCEAARVGVLVSFTPNTGYGSDWPRVFDDTRSVDTTPRTTNLPKGPPDGSPPPKEPA